MKRCPECRRDYYDDSLFYCLDDGSALLGGPADESQTATAILHSTEAPNPAVGTVAHRSGGSAFTHTSRTPMPPAASVAVLPFALHSSDPSDEYFCDGLADELINTLARVDGLHVVARTSAFSFKAKHIEIGQIGSILNVQNIVEGSVRKFGERMRISVQLINASDGYHVWSGKFDTDLRDLFDVQDEITLAVVNALKAKLLGKPELQSDERMTSLLRELKQHANDIDAYQEYLRGRYFFNKFTPDGFSLAIDCYNRSVAIDPNFSAAYAGLAEAHAFSTEFGPVPPQEGMPKARDAAMKALALGAGSSEAHAALGLVLCEFDWDFHESEKQFRRAIELNPNNAVAHHYFGGLLAQLCRPEEAEPELQKAHELDPLSPMVNWIYPYALFFQKRYDEAIDKASTILDLEPNFAAALLVLSFCHEMKENFTESVDAFVKYLELFGATAAADRGRTAFEQGGWQAFLLAMTSDQSTAAIPAYVVAVFHDTLGDKEAALLSLERSLKAREGYIMMLKADPRFRAIRSDVRFQSLIDRIGL